MTPTELAASIAAILAILTAVATATRQLVSDEKIAKRADTLEEQLKKCQEQREADSEEAVQQLLECERELQYWRGYIERQDSSSRGKRNEIRPTSRDDNGSGK